MSKIIKDSGIYIDVVVPLEHSQVFLDIIEHYKGCSIDLNNCFADGDNYTIRINAKILGQGGVYQMIRETAQELGIDV